MAPFVLPYEITFLDPVIILNLLPLSLGLFLLSLLDLHWLLYPLFYLPLVVTFLDLLRLEAQRVQGKLLLYLDLLIHRPRNFLDNLKILLGVVDLLEVVVVFDI